MLSDLSRDESVHTRRTRWMTNRGAVSAQMDGACQHESDELPTLMDKIGQDITARDSRDVDAKNVKRRVPTWDVGISAAAAE
jgi:hypothetical protein